MKSFIDKAGELATVDPAEFIKSYEIIDHLAATMKYSDFEILLESVSACFWGDKSKYSQAYARLKRIAGRYKVTMVQIACWYLYD